MTLFARLLGCSILSHTKRDFYQDIYTILNRIELTILTICVFRVVNPRQ